MTTHKENRADTSIVLLRAIYRLLRQRLKRAIKAPLTREDAPGDNFPDFYWRSA